MQVVSRDVDDRSHFVWDLERAVNKPPLHRPECETSQIGDTWNLRQVQPDQIVIRRWGSVATPLR